LEYQEGNYESAREHLERAEEFSSDPEIAEHLGEVYYRLALYREAAAAWQRALDQKDDPALRHRLDEIKDLIE